MRSTWYNTANRVVAQRHHGSVVFTCSQFNHTIEGLISVAATCKMIRRSILVSAFVISSSSRNLVLVPWGFHRCFLAVQQCWCMHQQQSMKQRTYVPPCALGRVPIAGYVCSPHGMLLLGSDCRDLGQNCVFPESCMSSQKQNGPVLKSSQTRTSFHLCKTHRYCTDY